MSEEKRYSGEDCQRMFLELRGLDPDVDHPCKGCDGAGKKVYGSTATWRGGCGGQMMTTDVCDRCWGSGDANRPWPSWRHGQPEPAKRDLPKTRELIHMTRSLTPYLTQIGYADLARSFNDYADASEAELDAAEAR